MAHNFPNSLSMESSILVVAEIFITRWMGMEADSMEDFSAAVMSLFDFILSRTAIMVALELSSRLLVAPLAVRFMLMHLVVMPSASIIFCSAWPWMNFSRLGTALEEQAGSNFT